MKRIIKLSAALLLGLCLCFSLVTMDVTADVGNHNSYSGSSSSSSSSSSSRSYSSSSSSGGSFSGDIGFLPILIIIAFIVWSKLPKNVKANIMKSAGSSLPNTSFGGAADMPQSIESQIKAKDPDFSSEKFLSWAEEVFMTLQDAWTKREWKLIRPFECEALFNKHSKQLDEYIRNNTINVVERICVNKSYISNYSTDNQYEYLTVYMKTRMNDYVIDATTKQVVKGDKDREFFTNYNLKFMRSLGVKTTVNSGKSTTNCPNCGAPTQITSAGECEYCGSVITTGQHDWVLCDLDSAE